MYYVYVLLSLHDFKFYIGSSRNVYKRYKRHERGNVRSTKSRRPLRLLFYEFHLSKKDALRREKYFKTTNGKSTLRLMLRDSIQRQE